MKRKILLIALACIISLVMIFVVFSEGRGYVIRGSFTPSTTWTGWSPGTILFDIGDSNSGSRAMLNWDSTLSGSFWLGNVGWATFDHGVSNAQARLVCPADILSRPNQVCPLYGYAWSENAGWIVLSGSLIDSSSTGVYYNPKTAIIQGWWWSSALGWVPFYAKTSEEIAEALDPSAISVDGISVNFIWQIAVLGNVAGNRIFDLEEQSVWYVFTTATHASIINKIRQNIALISRNIADAELSNPTSTHNFLIQKDADYEMWIWDVWPTHPTNKRTIIVVGHDIVLDTSYDIWDPNNDIPRALIALKDANGKGGNIIISEKTKRIYSMLYAEGSIFSGVKKADGTIKSYVSDGPFSIPARQLYIKWLLISKNTIWWARQDPYVCPVTVDDCDQSTAEKYDLNYFRTYDPNNPSQQAIPSNVPSQASWSAMVIDYNPSLLSDPPPGLADVIQ